MAGASGAIRKQPEYALRIGFDAGTETGLSSAISSAGGCGSPGKRALILTGGAWTCPPYGQAAQRAGAPARAGPLPRRGARGRLERLREQSAGRLAYSAMKDLIFCLLSAPGGSKLLGGVLLVWCAPNE